MKKLLSFLLAIALSGAMMAQNHLENFEQGSRGWTSDGSWQIDQLGIFVSADYIAYSAAYDTAGFSNVLISPSFTLSEANDNDVISFYLGAYLDGADSVGYKVAIIVDGSNTIPITGMSELRFTTSDWNLKSFSFGALRSAYALSFSEALTGSHTYNFVIYHTASYGGLGALLFDNFAITAQNTFTAHFAQNGAEGSMAEVTIASNGNYTVPQCDFTRDNCEFSHWLMQTYDSVYIVTPGAEVQNVDCNLFFYPEWANYAAFIGDSTTTGTMDTLWYLTGEPFIAPDCDFNKASAQFLGWYVVDADGEYVIYPGDTVIPSAHMDFYACWADEFTISFDNNGGEGVMGDSTVLDGSYGFYLVLPTPTFTHATKTFAYWCDKADGTGFQAMPGDTVCFTSNETIYAIWKGDSDKTVTFVSLNPYAEGTMADMPVVPGNIYSVPECCFYDEYTTFIGWLYYDESGALNWYFPDGEYVGKNYNDTLYAYFAYQITYNFNDSTSLDLAHTQVVNYAPLSDYSMSDTIVIPNGPAREGYTFFCWTSTGYDTILPGYEVNISYNITLYAVWKAGESGDTTSGDDPEPSTCQDVTTETTISVCDTYSWFEHTNVTTSGTLIHTAENVIEGACDSIYKLYLTIKQGNHSSETVTACGSYYWRDANRTATGVYTYPYVDATTGCNSVDTLNLTIGTTFNKTITKSECVSFSWRGNTYTASGTYTDYVQQSGVACDSNFTLVLTINPIEYDTIAQTANDAYYWQGQTYTTSGMYTAKTGQTAYGCDKYTVLNLTINKDDPNPNPNPDDPQGIADLDDAAVVVYPNPVQNILTVQGVSVLRLEVLDMSGRQVSAIEGTSTIDLSGLSNGIYMLRVNAVEGKALRKIIKK